MHCGNACLCKKERMSIATTAEGVAAWILNGYCSIRDSLRSSKVSECALGLGVMA